MQTNQPHSIWDMQQPLRSLYTACVEPLCLSCGITRTELDILLFLANNPKYDTAAEISEIRRLAKSHVSISLRSLEENGYITRESEKADKRLIHLRLTEKASRVVQEGRQRQAAFAELIMDGFQEEERRQLHSFLVRMRQNIEHHLEELEK